MKRIASLLASALVLISAFAQGKPAEDFKFTTIKANPISSVKNQNQTATCWCVSSLGFFESELMRMGKGQHELCVPFVVTKTMFDRATKAVRMHGDVSYAEGGSFYDALYCLKHYGLIPEGIMPKSGSLVGSDLPNTNQLRKEAISYVESLSKSDAKHIPSGWLEGLKAIYTKYLGECPDVFTYEGKEYTPLQYAQSLGLNADDYVSLTSFTHHPFYTTFAIEVPDNWRWGLSYNLPLDEFMQVMDYAIDNGFTFAWGSDTSTKGYNRDGLAFLPTDEEISKASGPDKVPLGTIWSISAKEFKYPTQEISPSTQEMRQKAYDEWDTTDDHGMQIFGKAKDQGGKEYFMVKNSFGTDIARNGIWYASRNFVAYKTINIVLHKDAIPKEIRKKLGL